jgi:voltage-gated potassium channel
MKVPRISKNNSEEESTTLWPFVSVLFVLVLSLGTFGYMAIEGWDWFDSFYMTVITVATVGFAEIHPLSGTGRLLTIALIFLGVTVFVFATSATAQIIFRQQFQRYFRNIRMEHKIQHLSQHVIVCGYGRMSQAMVKDLVDNKLTVVVIESSLERMQKAVEDKCLGILGDASEEENLLKANVMHAKCLVSLIPKDSENLYVAMAARELSPELLIVCRAEDEASEKRLLKAGANKVISPYRVGGQKIARSVLKPNVTNLLELSVLDKNGKLEIEEIKVPSSSSLIGKTLQEANLREDSNLILVGLLKPDGTALFNPSPSEFILAGMTLIALGSKTDLAVLDRKLEKII